MVSRILVMQGYTPLIIFLFACMLSISYQNADASNNVLDTGTTDKTDNSLGNELSEGFDASLRILSYGIYQGVAGSSQNPDNDFLRIPRFQANLDIRPDLYLQFRKIELSIKPRTNVLWSAWEDGALKGDRAWEDDWYINEWLFKLGVSDSLFLSYGRENLQWGPSYLFSPSNPFFEDNGRMNPKLEVPGMDFARLIWVPSIKWAVSFITNTDEGRQIFEHNKFHRGYAVKIDYTGDEEYIGLILSHKERHRIGAFCGWTATDALLLYADIGFSQGNDALYPVYDNLSPFGASMLAVNEESSVWNQSVMMGASYTFLAGPTVSVEYLYNDTGYSDKQSERYYQLRHNAMNAYYEDGPISGLSRMVLGQTVNPGIRFLRKNYLVLQYRQNDIRDVLSLSLNVIRNIDDKGLRLISNLEYTVGDHVQIFSIGSLNTGESDAEFRSAFDSSFILGLEYTF